MSRQLVLREYIPDKKRTFKDELNELVLSLDLPKYANKTGNHQFTENQKLSCVILYFRSKKSLRQFCEEFKESQWPRWLELKYELKKSTLNDWVQYFDLDLIKKLLDQTNSGENPEVVGIDGTGVETQFKSSYYEKRLKDFGRKPKANYHKLDIIANMKGKKKILDFSFLMKQQHDSPIGKRLLKRFKFRNIIIVADKGYFCFESFELVKQMNNYLLFPPKNYGEKTQHNRLLHKKIKEDYHKYKDIYNLRNNVESIFSALKRTVLDKIVSRKCSTKKREMAWKIVIYNMKKNLFQLFFLELKY